MQRCREIGGRVESRIVKRRKSIFKTSPKPPPGIIERFINVRTKFLAQSWKLGGSVAPEPQTVAWMAVRKLLVDEPGIQQTGRQAPGTGSSGARGDFVASRATEASIPDRVVRLPGVMPTTYTAGLA